MLLDGCGVGLEGFQSMQSIPAKQLEFIVASCRSLTKAWEHICTIAVHQSSQLPFLSASESE
eukprot:4418501-Amphidinium_carterae.2